MLCEKYGLMNKDDNPDWSELITVALRIMYVIDREEGIEWIEKLIGHWRSYPNEVRNYDVSEDEDVPLEKGGIFPSK